MKNADGGDSELGNRNQNAREVRAIGRDAKSRVDGDNLSRFQKLKSCVGRDDDTPIGNDLENANKAVWKQLECNDLVLG